MPDIRPPSWLSPAEKRAFRSVVAARAATHFPIEVGEIDAAADYAVVRSRVEALHRSLAEATEEAERMRLHRALMGAIATSRRLARGLNLSH